jgi:putative ABC transport system permease protein
LYRTEKRQGEIFGTFAMLAIFVACLGLVGLASFAAEQRTKEIGIRKVLGASVSGIVTLLSSEFLALILLANVIAWPVAYFIMKKWLEHFAYRIDVDALPFLGGAAAALLIAMLTVSFQTIKAAMANPAEALRYE